MQVSASYPTDDAAQRWTDLFAGLVHGSELSLLTVYVATPPEVAALCETEHALGCFGGNRLIIPGETVDGVPPESVARHE